MSRPKSLEGNKEYILTQGKEWLESKFRLPVVFDDEVVFILAQIYTFGEGESLWLNGEEVKDIKIRLVIDSQTTNTTNSNEP